MPRLRPRARLVRTIGDQLISGPEAALIELVKNSYDADSPYVLLWIMPQGSPEAAQGAIFIVDEGHGMSEAAVVEKWLEPATDEKLLRRDSPSGRRMLGAKGIGRFAAARLGKTTKMESVFCQKSGSLALTTVDVNWDWFQSAKYLDEVDIPVKSEDLPATTTRKTGVTLEIRDLRDEWTKKRLEILVRELRRIASPHDKELEQFKIRLDLSSFTLDIHGFDGQQLLTDLNFSPGADQKEEADPLLIRPFALQKHADYKIDGRFDKSGGFVGTFVVERGDSVVHELAVPAPNLTAEEDSCGPLRLRINVYDRETDAISSLFARMGLTFEKIGVQLARRILTENAGIAIFRKGFRIRPYGDPDNDWLELERQRVQDPSRKLGISQVSGAVDIEDEDGSGLIERSSREGLEHTRSFERLKHLISNVLIHVEARRYDFREKAGLSRKAKGDLSKVRETATLKRAMKAASVLPPKYRKTVELALGRDAADLATELAEIDDFQQALQSRAALGLVVAEVLHEGRRLLNPVSTSTKALIEGSDWILEESKRGKVFRDQFPVLASTINSGVLELGRLFKRLDPISGRRRGRPKHFLVADVVTRSLELFRDQIEINSIDVEVEVEESLEAYGYEEDLQAALMNLFDNAIFWLGTQKGRREVSVSAKRSGKWVSIRVANNGPPIDAAYVARLFDAGFTLKADGTGLGLAIAREAIRRSNGDLNLDEASADTSFVVRLRTEIAK